jgi:hypothetical protein
VPAASANMTDTVRVSIGMDVEGTELFIYNGDSKEILHAKDPWPDRIIIDLPRGLYLIRVWGLGLRHIEHFVRIDKGDIRFINNSQSECTAITIREIDND